VVVVAGGWFLELVVGWWRCWLGAGAGGAVGWVLVLVLVSDGVWVW